MNFFNRAVSNNPKDKRELSAKEAYMRKAALRKRLAILLLLAIYLLEFALSSGISEKIKKEDLLNRLAKEHEMRQVGQVKLRGGNYTGDIDFGEFSDEGTFEFISGASYSGSWSGNQLSGRGVLHIPDEGEYTGEFANSQKNGNGVFTWDDGDVYDGSWIADRMEGAGIYTTAKGVKYDGTFHDNVFVDGVCTFENETGRYSLQYKDGYIVSASIVYVSGITYEGDVNEKTLHGTGKMVFTNQDVYEGGFVDGIRCGTGVYVWPSGDRYDGEWVDDKMSGSGVYTFANGRTLNGLFENNSFSEGEYHIINEYGDYTFSFQKGTVNSVSMKLVEGTEYIGEVNEKGLNGQAQITYSNGDKYSGTVSAGLKSGHGVYEWTSGASYDGQWADDTMSGKGEYYYPKSEPGYKLVGNYKNGLPDGECTYYTTTSTHYLTTWSEGKCIKVTE